MRFAEWAEVKEAELEQLPDANEFEYLACVLHLASQKELIRAAQKYMLEHTGSLIPPHWIGRAHHMTVKYRPTNPDVRALAGKFGKPAMITVEAIAHDERCIAAIVRSTVGSASSIPHVTIAHSPEVGAVYSNDMLKDRTKWHRYLEIGELYSYLLGVKPDDSYWPNVVGQLASHAPVVK